MHNNPASPSEFPPAVSGTGEQTEQSPQQNFWTPGRKWILALCLGSSVTLGILSGITVTLLGEIPLASDLKAYQPSLTTKIYDRQGQLITELFSEKRTLIKLENVPQPLQQAVLAIEDNNFYQHFGIQFSGIIRSLMVNLLHKRFQQGGSTITQQLARNMFLTRRKTIERKIKEIILALQIERTYAKREIMEMYLNQIYFGNGAYGVESAARAYFGKHVQELDLAECALLAGLPRAPNNYNPYRNLERALQRRNLVLAQMQRLGYITPQEAAQAKALPPKLSSIDVSQAPYFVEYVRRQLEDRYGSNALYKGGLKVQTTLDLAIQQMAQDTVNQGILEVEKTLAPNLRLLPGHVPETVQCAMVVIDPFSGDIKAMIGGRNFQESKFNRAVQAQRQPGSAFKPLIYTAALQQGFTEADVVLDAPMVVKNEAGQVWKPENFSNQFRGPTTLRSALTHSRNVVTVKLLEKIGVGPVIELARRMGISSQLQPYLTLALGASEVNLLELVSAYGCFPAKGIHAGPLSILRVQDAEGNTLEDNASSRQEVLDEATAYIMADMLANVVNSGTGYPVRNLGFKYPAAGKTGTTNDYTDAWFIGFTSEYVAGVWMGLDSHRSLGRGVTGGMVAAPIWGKFMLRLYADHAPRDFSRPDNVAMVSFCSVSGLLAKPECYPKVMEGAFLHGTSPTQNCDVHGASGNWDASALNVSPDMVDFGDNTPAARSAGGKKPDASASDQDEEPKDSEGTGETQKKPPAGNPKPSYRQVPPML